jgi:6-phosphofructokinase 1
MRVGLLTGGGDCPGLNGAIRAVVRSADNNGDEVIGFHHGWRSVVEGEGKELTLADTKGLLQSGGTILRTALYHPEAHEGGTEAVFETFERERLDG